MRHTSLYVPQTSAHVQNKEVACARATLLVTASGRRIRSSSVDCIASSGTSVGIYVAPGEAHDGDSKAVRRPGRALFVYGSSMASCRPGHAAGAYEVKSMARL